jgi:GNAT superfamily N-acetyltransferase
VTSVRRYRPSDAAAVRSLHERVIRAAGTDPSDLPNTDDVTDIESEYLDAGGEFLVAERGGHVVGMGGLRVDGHEGELHRMRVARDCQREGVGSALLAALETAAHERGVTRLHARTARRQRAAVAFYPANGYEQVDTETHGEYDLVVYRKRLGERDQS